MDRIESFLLMSVAVGALMFAAVAGYHAADRAYVSKLPVVKLDRVVVTAQDVPGTATPRSAI